MIFSSLEKTQKHQFKLGALNHGGNYDELKERVDRTKNLPKGYFMACSIGQENNLWVAYISWMEI